MFIVPRVKMLLWYRPERTQSPRPVWLRRNSAAQTSAELEEIVNLALCEAQIESLVIAKGYADCVTYIADNAVSVAVAAPEGGLQQRDVAVIADIVVTQSGYTMDKVYVVEVK